MKILLMFIWFPHEKERCKVENKEKYKLDVFGCVYVCALFYR